MGAVIKHLQEAIREFVFAHALVADKQHSALAHHVRPQHLLVDGNMIFRSDALNAKAITI